MELNSNYDYSSITSFGDLFYDCNSLESIPSNATNMNFMFSGCCNIDNYDFSTIKNEQFKEKYPELFI